MGNLKLKINALSRIVKEVNGQVEYNKAWVKNTCTILRVVFTGMDRGYTISTNLIENKTAWQCQALEIKELCERAISEIGSVNGRTIAPVGLY